MSALSIIIPIYNAEKYIHRCVDSVLKQTFKDFELILVDDGSTDKSGRICDEYADRDDRVKVIHKQNGGVSEARNTGIASAIGKNLMFVDSDDYIDENMLRLCMENKNDGIDMIITSLAVLKNGEKQIFHINEGVYSPKSFFEAYCAFEFDVICADGPCCKIYDREIIASNNIRFDEKMSLGEDTCFVLEYITFCKNIKMIDKVCYYYVFENSESLTTKIQYNFYEQQSIVHNRIIELAERVNTEKEYINKYIKIRMENLISMLFGISKKSSCEYAVHYMECMSGEEFFRKHINCISKKKYRIIAKLIMRGCYKPVYAFCVFYTKIIDIIK